MSLEQKIAGEEERLDVDFGISAALRDTGVPPVIDALASTSTAAYLALVPDEVETVQTGVYFYTDYPGCPDAFDEWKVKILVFLKERYGVSNFVECGAVNEIAEVKRRSGVNCDQIMASEVPGLSDEVFKIWIVNIA
jgi:hypothetical protein